ncbi:DNA-directed RNA polymerase III [Microthyrium microscopicum]|uniref:DNA-directed RNA polymerase subunit n=1 Tax=Microthyrium microscopicum TaxID=703497 RepID=A0A6A6TZ18_9PEZI|nr:DNA-directed RNA polymerase III [Microthyrium microscopicum]
MIGPLGPAASALPKGQVSDRTPMRIGALDFGVMSQDEIEKQAQLEVSDRNLYDLDAERNPTKNGPLDRHLGTSSKTAICATCGHEQRSCNGHWGFVRLEAPCFHIGFLAFTVEVLNQICKSCSRILLPHAERQNYLKSLRKPNLDSFQKKKLLQRLQADCKKVRRCPHCDSSNGPVRKVPGHACKLMHLKFEFFFKSAAKSKVAPPDKDLFDKALDNYTKKNPDNARHMKKALDDLPAIKVHRLFCAIPTEDCELLGLNLQKGRPESYLWTHLPIPPPNIRPSVPGDQGTTEDELTTKLSEIIDLNTRLREAIRLNEHLNIQMDYYEKLQDHIAMYINSHAPGLNKSEYGKAIRSFCSRLKGKQGRFRGNLSGKRVNFSGRTVISPDPNLSIEEVGIPEHVAKILSYPQMYAPRLDSLKRSLEAAIKNGPERYPGANGIQKLNGPHISLKVAHQIGDKKIKQIIAELQPGDIIHRHLINGDIVLFNRQPSLHKLSVLCHRVRVHQSRTFRFNESVCNPYNADFDGDEMNIHVPQTEEARAEALQLMGVKHNLVTPKNGAPIIAPIQDFITASYLISHKDQFFNKSQFSQIIGYMFDADMFEDPDTGKLQRYELPPPTIRKPMYLWTGKQVFNVLMRPSRECKVLVNVEGKLKQFKPNALLAPDMSPEDAYMVVRNSEVMCGQMDKSAIGDGNKSSIFFVILRDFGEDYAVQGMNRLAKLSSRWLAHQGFSIGVGDVYPSDRLTKLKNELTDSAGARVKELIAMLKNKTLTRDPGCDMDQTLENRISKILSEVRNDAGQACFNELSPHNAAVIMAKSGSKGSMINVSQMAAGVGQQMIGGARVENGFQDRTLPHFDKGSRDPASKGFVANSFFSGLTPTEFIFHAMSGREGLVDTAVKTAETGYMSRRLIKSLEDAFVVYDKTVRNSSGKIIQFSFGDDFLDPAELEGNKKPIAFERTFRHAIETTRTDESAGLVPQEIIKHVRAALASQLKIFVPHSNDDIDEVTSDKEISDDKADSDQSARRFIKDVHDYLHGQINRLKGLRKKYIDTAPAKGPRSAAKSVRQAAVDRILLITPEVLDTFFKLCWLKYGRSVTQPAHAVGAIAAQSIGEPGTQMTLRTFHFAGVTGMSITGGVPRIKEIINAAKKISTPVINCVLMNKSDPNAARYVQSRIEKTYLRDIARNIEDEWASHSGCIRVVIDMAAVSSLQLDITIQDIAKSIAKTKGLKLKPENVTIIGDHILQIMPKAPEAEVEMMDLDGNETDEENGTKRGGKRKSKGGSAAYYQSVLELRRNILSVVVKGHPDTSRAIISQSEKNGQKQYELLVEGYGLKDCLGTEGVDGRLTATNGVMETCNVLGIEAARRVIIQEIQKVMESMDIDDHHIHLLACIMTLKGEVLGITRFGMAKMGDSVLQLASFEKTPDHLFDAATKMKSDPISGVSESIIMGQTVKLGTGAASVFSPLKGLPKCVGAKQTIFHNSWKEGCLDTTGWSDDTNWSVSIAKEVAMVEAGEV